VVDGAEPIGERGDRSVVGDVHDFGADPRIVGVAIGIGQFGFCLVRRQRLGLPLIAPAA
jgi:hypothetical protein